MTTTETIAALVGAGFPDHSVVLAKHVTASKECQAAVVVSVRCEDPACFVALRISAQIVALGSGVASTSTAASSVVSCGCRNFLFTSDLLVSWRIRDPFNGSLQVGVGSRRGGEAIDRVILITVDCTLSAWAQGRDRMQILKEIVLLIGCPCQSN